jgi:uroporphyrinogen decarboxylase
MDPAQVKKDFGDQLALWGTVDIQETLPFGSPEDVANEVKLRIRTAGTGGGLLLAPAHNIQAEVPVENILAFYESAKRYGRYPIES